jgi:hypothetical protein
MLPTQANHEEESPAQGTPRAHSPDMQVARRIVAGLERSGLILPDQSDPLRTGLATGELAADDWIVIARRATDTEQAAGDAHD